MRQYRPTIEELKKRYSCEMARKKMIAKRHAANPSLATRNKIPDNSEPWLPHGLPRSVDECAWISEQVSLSIEQWKQILAEAKDMLDRFVDPEVLQYGLDNSNADVREHVLALLHEFEAEGDPYSREILAAWCARQV